MLTLNALITIKPYFRAFKAWRLVLIGTSSARFRLSDSLWQENVAFGYPHEEYLYFKGDPDVVLRKIRKLIKVFDKRELFFQEENPGLEEVTLGVDNEVIIKPIMYASIKSLLTKKGFIHPYKKSKKAIPKIDPIFEKLGFIEYLSNDIVILYGSSICSRLGVQATESYGSISILQHIVSPIKESFHQRDLGQ